MSTSTVGPALSTKFKLCSGPATALTALSPPLLQPLHCRDKVCANESGHDATMPPVQRTTAYNTSITRLSHHQSAPPTTTTPITSASLQLEVTHCDHVTIADKFVFLRYARSSALHRCQT